MTSEKTFEEINEFVSGTVIREVYTPQSEYPHYFLGDVGLGWAEYIDTSNFDPFEVLGFKVIGVNVEVPEAYYDEHGYAIDDDITEAFHATSSYAEVQEKIWALNPDITFTESSDEQE